ncbi:hypothetical protein RND81_10G075100 [Saponaria officinalis]|uniref:AAA+ ATPase domain-containing protein n=1 Tax=Saponaria officinalis TaxID=3572 RepID=A0AAW1I1I8_SAPOF
MKNMNNKNDMFMQFGSMMATIMFLRALYNQYLPYQWRESINSFFLRYTERFAKVFSPYLKITFEEFTGERFSRSKMYTTIETYLSESTSRKARSLKANFVKDGNSLVLGLGDNQEVTDEFQGVKVWWNSHKKVSRSQTITFYPGADDKRYYRLTFHNRHRDLITESYLQHVIDEGKAIAIRKRQRRLFTNIKESGGGYYSRGTLWTHVEFKHPATFNTLAMEKTKKQTIIDDLLRFTIAKDYYLKIGKPWKRGYQLYGPPGTGKSTLIAAMANLLEYDIYDLELTAVKDNTELRRLLIETSSKSIIVIEDIDCSLELTGQRVSKKKAKEGGGDEEKEDEKKAIKKKLKEESESKKSEVTLSGLLNFIDGIWSACGEERLIIFTTNYIEKLDPALIRRGRMDMHIELSYCCYEAFKLLAKNYLDTEDHPLFERIKILLEEIKMTPADVAENLMPKSLDLDVEVSLENLIIALEKVKEDEKLKAREEEKEKEKLKVQKEEDEKKEKKEENEVEKEENEKEGKQSPSKDEEKKKG